MANPNSITIYGNWRQNRARGLLSLKNYPDYNYSNLEVLVLCFPQGPSIGINGVEGLLKVPADLMEPLARLPGGPVKEV